MEKQLVLPFSRTIREEFTDLHKDKHQIEKRHLLEIRQWRKKLEILQAKCDHPSETYFPDATGGSDSWFSCDECGKDSRTSLIHKYRV